MSIKFFISCGAQVGGGGINPLRTMLPWLFKPSKMVQNWTLIVGPTIGSGMSALVYRLYFNEDRVSENRDEKVEMTPGIEA